ncbi:hypothetical protein [Streptomyces sp. NPDC056244]|uniref:hypothetical protein n=1 Tax=Streptomyces sp. NPDC056244 TaxID=3345762 RepID=UPI0035DF4F41
MTQAADSPNRTNAASGLRFLTELIGWTATAWALHRVDWAVAIAALVLLIGLPAVVGTPDVGRARTASLALAVAPLDHDSIRTLAQVFTPGGGQA